MSATGPRRLYRSRSDRVVAGVCGGVGRYLEIDPVVIRVVWAVLAVAAGAGVLAYLLVWLIVPREP